MSFNYTVVLLFVWFVDKSVEAVGISGRGKFNKAVSHCFVIIIIIFTNNLEQNKQAA